jgi:hypothetical protein
MKEMTRYWESFGYGAKGTLNKRFYYFNGVSLLTEEG